MKKVIIILIIIISALFLMFHENRSINKEVVEDIKLADSVTGANPSSWVAIDDLGREMPTTIGKSTNHYRAVGMFYWPWHLSNNSSGPYNVNNISKANPDRIHDYEWWNQNYPMTQGSSYWWNEPIYGYYMENDYYVLRKQAELLADAGVDFIVFDCTNLNLTWKTEYENLLKVWLDAYNHGVNVPKIAFMLNFSFNQYTSSSFMDIYNNLYNPNSPNYSKYNSLFYKYNNKYLILMDKNNATASIKQILNDFEVRKVNRYYFDTGAINNGVWGWLSAYPQAYYKKTDGKSAEQTTVSIAQNATTNKKLTAMNAYGVMGRSFARGEYSYTYKYKNSMVTVSSSITGPVKSYNTSLYGRNFQQQWDYALDVDPEIVFVTGWNEWIMGRFANYEGVKNAFPDQFNDEYSRDIEPSKGELKDNYYYQLVSNIRKFKGVTAQGKQTTPITIKSTSDWNNSKIITYNHYTGGYGRDVTSFGYTTPVHYYNISFRNDIKKSKVSYDSSNIYFYVETANSMTPYNSDKWMRLLIDTKSSITSTDTDNWAEFEYIVNRTAGSSSKLILEKSKGGWDFTKVGEISYRVTSNSLEITIPREYLGFTGNNINFNFKWCDNNLANGDIMTVYTDGDSAPGGRFAFHFEGTAAYVKSKDITGDVNGDGKVNSQDYILIRKHILGIKLTGDRLKRADVNNDNSINSKDYIIIRKIILGVY